MKHLGWIISFFLGLGTGIAGITLAPTFLMPHLPQSLQGETEIVEGIVTRKERDADQLLITVSASHGATLVTFKKQVKEIDLLVEQQDTISLSVHHYEPFLFDPHVVHVKKPPQSLTREPLEDHPNVPAQKTPEKESSSVRHSLDKNKNSQSN